MSIDLAWLSIFTIIVMPKKLQDYGDITYHSKKHRYLQLYVPTQEVEQLVGRLSKEKFIKKVRACHIQELETPFVGNLYREENVIIDKVQEKCWQFSDNSVYS